MTRFIQTGNNPAPLVISDVFSRTSLDYHEPCWACRKDGQDECQGHKPWDPKEVYTFIRASGECTCDQCGLDYYSHPHSEHIGIGGYPVLRRLCDGTLVKL